VSGGSDFHLQAYFDRTVRHEANFAESRNTIDIDFLDRLMLPLHQTFLWGLGMRFSPGKATQVIPTIQFIPNQRTDKLYSGFVQDEIPLIGDRLSVTLGSKILHNIYTGFELQPSARLLWTPTANQSVWAGFTRGVRTPSRVDDEDMLSGLIAVSPPTFIRIIGDGKFDSERLLSYEAGYRSVVGSSIRFDVAVFYNNYDHLLSIEPGVAFAEASPSPAHTVIPYFIRNGVVATTYGIEIAPDWRPTTWWRLSGSYSFLHMDVGKTTSSQDPSTPASTEGSSPQQQAVVQSSFQLPKHLEFGQTYRYVGGLPAKQIPGYSTGDVWLGWQPGRFWELSVAGRDLLQPFHTESNGDPGPLVGIRRSVYVKITLRD
jgi:iron complex outermembrane receptor protein